METGWDGVCAVSGVGCTERLVNAEQGYFLRSRSDEERPIQLLPVMKTYKSRGLFKGVDGLAMRGRQFLFEVHMEMPLASQAWKWARPAHTSLSLPSTREVLVGQ